MSLRSRLGQGPIVAPGVYDALTARLVEEAGFAAAYLSGAGVSYTHLCQPDVGLVTQTEMVSRTEATSHAISIPLVCDGDNGHGNALNVMRTVRLFERAGAAAIQLEDQAFPKRCGHLEGKRLIPADEMVGKIRAARAARTSSDFLIIGRTDARSQEGLDGALARARAYGEAGADLLFVEAPQNRDELAEVARALHGKPLVANMVEGGKTPLLSAAELGELGYALILFPNSLLRRFVAAGRELLTELSGRGTTSGLLDRMASFQAVNDLTQLAALAEDERTFVPPAGGDKVGTR
jgi:2-methylisocitrate lyase-like PEP mutase family enzyme